MSEFRKRVRLRKKIIGILLLATILMVPTTSLWAAVSSGKATEPIEGVTVVDTMTLHGAKVDAVYRPYFSGYGDNATYSCAAYIKKFYKKAFGNADVYNLLANRTPLENSNKGQFVVTKNPVPGDIVRKNGTRVHWMIVKAVQGNTVTVIQQNSWADTERTMARTGVTMSKAEAGYTFFHFQAKVTSVAMNRATQTLWVGKSTTLGANVVPAYAHNRALTWKSSNSSVATVDKTGKVVAKKKGTAVITCTSTDGTKKSGKCIVTVVQPVQKITLKTSYTVVRGGKLTLSPAVAPSNANNKAVTYKTSNSAVATVTAGGIVTTKSPGIATITCTAKDGSQVKTTCSIIVKPGNTNLVSVKNNGFRKATVTWKTQTGITGYKIVYSTNSNFTKASTVYVTGAKISSKSITGLSYGKTYYFKVYGYSKINKVNQFGTSGSARSVKIRL